MPCASLMARTAGRAGTWLKALVTVPFVLPTIVVGGAFKELFERGNESLGIPDLNHTAAAIIVAHSFFNFAVVARTVGAYWSGLDHQLEEQARLLGSSNARVFRQVTWPRLKPAVFAAGAITFLFSFTSFGVVLVLGGLGQATIETEIFRHAVVRGDLLMSSSLALIQIAAVVCLVAVTSNLERRANTSTQMIRSTITPMRRSTKLGVVSFTVIFLGSPLLIMIERSLRVADRYGMQNYWALFEKIPQLPTTSASAFGNSVVYGLIATALALGIGLLCAMAIVSKSNALGRGFDIAATLPLGVSAVTVGLGILISLNRPPIDWRTSWWIVPIAHSLVAIPFVVRSLVPMLRQIHPSIREAAALLGSSPLRIRREIDIPLVTRGLTVAAGFAFAISLGEFGATSFLPRRADTLTGPQAIFRLLSTPGDVLRGQAMALSVVVALAVAVAVISSELLAARTTRSVNADLPVGS
jgi:thiamine transport system permease protein